jgi:hypothetical protein
MGIVKEEVIWENWSSRVSSLVKWVPVEAAVSRRIWTHGGTVPSLSCCAQDPLYVRKGVSLSFNFYSLILMGVYCMTSYRVIWDLL